MYLVFCFAKEWTDRYSLKKGETCEVKTEDNFSSEQCINAEQQLD